VHADERTALDADETWPVAGPPAAPGSLHRNAMRSWSLLVNLAGLDQAGLDGVMGWC